jgi:hypothetical protein
MFRFIKYTDSPALQRLPYCSFWRVRVLKSGVKAELSFHVFTIVTLENKSFVFGHLRVVIPLVVLRFIIP